MRWLGRGQARGAALHPHLRPGRGRRGAGPSGSCTPCGAPTAWPIRSRSRWPASPRRSRSPRSTIDRDDDGTPTGVLKESAMDLVTRLIPRLGPDEQREGIRALVGAPDVHGRQGGGRSSRTSMRIWPSGSATRSACRPTNCTTWPRDDGLQRRWYSSGRGRVRGAKTGLPPGTTSG